MTARDACWGVADGCSLVAEIRLAQAGCSPVWFWMSLWLGDPAWYPDGLPRARRCCCCVLRARRRSCGCGLGGLAPIGELGETSLRHCSPQMTPERGSGRYGREYSKTAYSLCRRIWVSLTSNRPRRASTSTGIDGRPRNVPCLPAPGQARRPGRSSHERCGSNFARSALNGEQWAHRLLLEMSTRPRPKASIRPHRPGMSSNSRWPIALGSAGSTTRWSPSGSRPSIVRSNRSGAPVDQA